MGGNALSIPSVRLASEPYWKLWESVKPRLELLYEDVVLVPAYKTKSSFGDMDVLVNGCKVHPVQVIHTLGAAEESRNGNVWSLGLPTAFGMFQVDLINCKKEELQFSEVYFAYNDLGNLMGRIAHKMGFKYGHDGLWYVIRDPQCPSQVVKEVLVSRDLYKVFAMMGYDYEAWLQKHRHGFNTLEEVFEYVVDNPWFSKEIYLLENRNNIARVRDRKRASYTAFLQWCQKPEVKNSWKWNDQVKKTIREYRLQQAFITFPAFADEYKRVLGKHTIKKMGKVRFNGEVVMNLTGLQGKELGEFMCEFKKSWIDEDHFWHWASVVEQHEVEKAVMTKFMEWKK